MNKTKEHLLRCACELIGEVGFKNATVAEVCTRANANVAAVNYHFGDKENLYAHAWRYAYQRAEELAPFNFTETDDPKETLKGINLTFLKRIFSDGPESYLPRIIVRELAHPTSALDDMITEILTPMRQRLRMLVQAIVPNATTEQVQHTVMSIHAQVVFFAYNKPVRERMHDMSDPDEATIERLADHITSFSLKGMEIYA